MPSKSEAQESVYIGIALPSRLKARLAAEAERNHRSMSEETRIRLAQSLRGDDAQQKS